MDKFESLENEIWIDAKSFTTDYTGLYLVSNMGRCWSIKRNQFVGSLCRGYWMVGLSKNNKQETMIIGRLMLTSFGVEVPEHLKDLPTNKLQAMHLDGDSTNNHLDNFQWGDAKENNNEINHKIRCGKSRKGQRHTEEARKKISDAMKGENNHFYGKQHTEETKRKMSISHKIKKEVA